MDDGRIEIGRVTAPHGVRGEFRVALFTDFPERFESMEVLHLYDASGTLRRTLTVSGARIRQEKNEVLIRAEEISDRDEAEALRGLSIRIAPEERVDLPDGEFWIDDLIGLSVVDEDGDKPLGTVTDVMVTGGADVYMVTTPEGALRAVPAVRRYVVSVDLDGGTIVVRDVEDLWNL